MGMIFCGALLRALEESRRANEAWIVSARLYWERLNAMFYKSIFEERILLGKRRELVLLPESEENRYRKDTLINRYKEVNPNVEQFLRILLISDSRIFAFLFNEISIYDAGTYDVRAILLEPMAGEGLDEENDARIAAAIASKDIRDLRFHNLREATFDLALPKFVAESMCVAFKRVWNEECLKVNMKSWLL